MKNMIDIANKFIVDNDSKSTIKSNLEVEIDIAKNMTDEINKIDEFINYIIENKGEFLTIERSVVERVVSSKYEPEYPSEYYSAGKIQGTYVYNHNEEEDCADDEKSCCEEDKEANDEKTLIWTEWKIDNTNGDYYDRVNIEITPFVVKIRGGFRESNKSTDSTISIFSSDIFDKWDTKLLEVFMERKKEGVISVISNSYKALGLDRQIKIESIIGKEKENSNE